MIRHLEERDYDSIISVIDDWWGGRKMSHLLPRIFFIHFRPTSFAVEEGGSVIGFLAGFVSQTNPEQAYIHFVGIHPEHRRRSLGRELYKRFFDSVRAVCAELRTEQRTPSAVRKNSLLRQQSGGP